MSGISIATIIMEAGEKSGALRQADHCIKQGYYNLLSYGLESIYKREHILLGT